MFECLFSVHSESSTIDYTRRAGIALANPKRHLSWHLDDRASEWTFDEVGIKCKGKAIRFFLVLLTWLVTLTAGT